VWRLALRYFSWQYQNKTKGTRCKLFSFSNVPDCAASGNKISLTNSIAAGNGREYGCGRITEVAPQPQWHVTTCLLAIQTLFVTTARSQSIAYFAAGSAPIASRRPPLEMACCRKRLHEPRLDLRHWPIDRKFVDFAIPGTTSTSSLVG
jgi:hypothetical protein